MSKKIVSYTMVILIALMMALNYQLFVFPNSFAPAGVDGICTMIQDLAGFSMGYLSLLVNIPLLLLAFWKLDRGFAGMTAVYVVSFSVATILLREVDLSQFVYHSESGTSIVLAPIAAGAIGFVLGLTVILLPLSFVVGLAASAYTILGIVFAVLKYLGREIK